jgi:CBS domain-containing protein
MQVKELMTRGVCTCGPNDSLAMAARMMWDHDCGAIPVSDNDGKTVAMITDRDICMAGASQDRPLSQIPVHMAASHQLATVREDDTIETAENLMARYQVRRLPVVDSRGRAVGMLSLNDLAKRANSSGSLKGGFTPERFTQTVAAIGRARQAPGTTANV